MRLRTLSSQVRTLFAAGLALALLSGCSTTTFESPPGGTPVACDPRLVGQWLSGEWTEHDAREPKRGHEDTERISIVAKECGLIRRDTGKCPSDLIGYRFSYLPDATATSSRPMPHPRLNRRRAGACPATSPATTTKRCKGVT